jgi:hypothetical protein
VVNILAHEGMHHVERHEDMGTWAQRLARCGWAVEDLRGEVPALALPAGLQVRGDEKGLRLLFRGEPLVAVLRASSVWH